jgi:hypothetical protein
LFGRKALLFGATTRKRTRAREQVGDDTGQMFPDLRLQLIPVTDHLCQLINVALSYKPVDGLLG